MKRVLTVAALGPNSIPYSLKIMLMTPATLVENPKSDMQKIVTNVLSEEDGLYITKEEDFNAYADQICNTVLPHHKSLSTGS